MRSNVYGWGLPWGLIGALSLGGCSGADSAQPAGAADGGVRSDAGTSARTQDKPKPIVSRFGASPAALRAGESSTLSWTTSNASSITLDPIGDVTGRSTTAVSPTSTTTYTFTAENASGKATATVTVYVAEGHSEPAATPLIKRSLASTQLLQNGKVLIAGGRDTSSSSSGLYPLASAELFDPAGDDGRGTWSATGALNAARAYASTVLLRNGKVLIAGGRDDLQAYDYLWSAELFDPEADGGKGSFSKTASLLQGRAQAGAALLQNGKVLIVGGWMADQLGSKALASAELFDPEADGGKGAFTSAGQLAYPRIQPTVTLLNDGRVLIAGGSGGTADGGFPKTAEIYDPVQNAFTKTGSLVTGRSQASATLLANGKVLIVGGWEQVHGTLKTAELFDPADADGAGRFVQTDELQSARESPLLVSLESGLVLIFAGRHSDFGAYKSVEVFDPAANYGAGGIKPAVDMSDFHDVTRGVLLPNGAVLMAGGNAQGTAELYRWP